MREVVRDGPRARPLRRGDAAASGVPGQVQPGAAMVALQEDVPVVPAAIHGSQDWKPGNFAPVSVAWGEPMRFDGLPKNGEGLPRGAPPRSSARSTRLWDWLGEMHALGRPDAATPPHERATETPEVQQPEIIGTVAIVGFPNVGKSTLSTG